VSAEPARAGGAAAPRLSPAMSWALAVGATLTMAVSYFDRQTLASIAPSVTADLGIDGAGYGLLVSAFSIAYLVGSPISGALVDRFGPRRALLVAVVVWTIVAALHSLAASFVMLFVLRIALGLTESPTFPGATATVTRALSPADRPRGFGLLFTGSSLGALLAPLAATKLDALYGWQVAFLVTAVAGLSWIPMWLLLTRGAAARRALDPIVVKVGAPAGGSIGRTAVHPAVLRAVVVVLATAPLASFVLNWSAKYLAEVEGIHKADIGAYLWLAPVLFDVGSLGFGHLATQHAKRFDSPPRVLFTVCGLLALALPLCLVFRGPWPLAVFAGVALAGVAGLFAIFTADMLVRVPLDSVSKAGGITAAAQSLAYIVASPLIGRSVDATGGYSAAIVVLSAIVAPGVVAWLLWKPPPPAVEPAAG
jgi:ACS family hexuronate transporter-like MFS transporter